MDEKQILHQHRMMGSEWHHTVKRRARGEIDIAEYTAIDEHVTTEMERLKYLYRGWQWGGDEERPLL